MTLIKKDLAILDKFEFDVPPVGVKFSVKRPDLVDRLGENMAFCEMLKRAQEGNVFYADAENHTCEAGLYVLGHVDASEPFISGQFGAGLKIFEEPRAASRLYQYIPKIGRDVVNYVAFSPIDKLRFEPDILIITADHAQAEIIMRSMTYSTGELYNSRTTPVMGCSWIFIYPFQSGKVNFIIPDMIHGMKGRELFPPNSVVISIPYHWIATMTKNLEEMTWHLPSHKSKDQYLEEFGTILGELAEKSKNP